MGGANDTFSVLGECTHGNFATPTRFMKLDQPGTVLGFDGQVYGECHLRATTGAHFYEIAGNEQKLIIKRPLKIIEPVKDSHVVDKLKILVQTNEVIPLIMTINCTAGSTLTFPASSNTPDALSVAGLYGDCQLFASTILSYYHAPDPISFIFLQEVSIQVAPVCRYLQPLIGTVYPPG